MRLSEKQGYAKRLLRFLTLLFIDCYGTKKKICLYGGKFCLAKYYSPVRSAADRKNHAASDIVLFIRSESRISASDRKLEHFATFAHEIIFLIQGTYHIFWNDPLVEFFRRYIS